MAKGKASKSSTGTDNDSDYDNLDGGFPQDEPGNSPTPRAPVLVWNDSKVRAFAYILRHPENEGGDTLDEITARVTADPAFSADVEAGAVTPSKLQLRRQQLIKSGLNAPPLRRRKGAYGSRTWYRPNIDELNEL